MMDEADKAAEQEERQREAALSHRKPVPERTGLCLNCDEPSQGAFCNAGCREDYERVERARKRNGLRMIEEEDAAIGGVFGALGVLCAALVSVARVFDQGLAK